MTSARSASARPLVTAARGATNTLWRAAKASRSSARRAASCEVAYIAVTWRRPSLPNTTDSMRARQMRSVIASTRTTSFSVCRRLFSWLPVPMRDDCHVPCSSTHTSADPKSKRPQIAPADWKQKAAIARHTAA